MKNIEVISLDAYGTLLNPEVGMKLALNKYIHIDKKGTYDDLWGCFFKEINLFFKKIEQEKCTPFICAKGIYEYIYNQNTYFQSLGLNADEFVQMICFAHSNASLYEGILELVSSLRRKYRLVILTSDADNDFLNKAINQTHLKFDHIITSEEAKGYKAEINSKLFLRLIEVSGTAPRKILHIGDSIYDTKRSRELGLSALLIDHDSHKTLTDDENSPVGMKGLGKLLLS